MKSHRNISLPFIPIFLFLMTLLGIFIGIETKNLIIEENNSHLVAIAEAKRDRLVTYLHGQEELISLLASSEIFRDFLSLTPENKKYQELKTSVHQRITRTVGKNPNFIDILLLDRQGISLLPSSTNLNENPDKSESEYFIHGRDGIFINDISLSPNVKQIIYTLSAPILEDGTGNLLGVVVIRIKPEAIYQIVSDRTNSSSTEETYLINEDRIFLTPSYYWGDKVILDQVSTCDNARLCFDPLEVNRIEKGLPGSHIGHDNPLECSDYRGVDTIGAHSYIPKVGWCLVSKMDQSEITGSVTRIMLTYALFWLLITTTLFLLLTLIGKKINCSIEEKLYRNLAVSIDRLNLGIMVVKQMNSPKARIIAINDSAVSFLGFRPKRISDIAPSDFVQSGFILSRDKKKISISTTDINPGCQLEYTGIFLSNKSVTSLNS